MFQVLVCEVSETNFFRRYYSEQSPRPGGKGEGGHSCSRRFKRSAGSARPGAHVTKAIALLDHCLLNIGLEGSPAQSDINGPGAPDPDTARPSLCGGGEVAHSVRSRCDFRRRFVPPRPLSLLLIIGRGTLTASEREAATGAATAYRWPALTCHPCRFAGWHLLQLQPQMGWLQLCLAGWRRALFAPKQLWGFHAALDRAAVVVHAIFRHSQCRAKKSLAILKSEIYFECCRDFVYSLSLLTYCGCVGPNALMTHNIVTDESVANHRNPL